MDSASLVNMNKSYTRQERLANLRSKSGKMSPNIFRNNLFSNEGECLEYLLDRFEDTKVGEGLMSSTDKMILREDHQMLSDLTHSDPLSQIYELMNNVERMMNSPQKQSKENYDFQFEKLLIMLKEEYLALYK
jgi:hypothetical protein